MSGPIDPRRIASKFGVVDMQIAGLRVGEHSQGRTLEIRAVDDLTVDHHVIGIKGPD